MTDSQSRGQQQKQQQHKQGRGKSSKPVRLHIVRPGAAAASASSSSEAAEALPATCTLWDAAVHADWCAQRTPENAHLVATLALAHVPVSAALPAQLQRRVRAGLRLGTAAGDAALLARARLLACSSVDAPLARGELVAVPHPRGGLVCAAVDGVVVAPRCFVDPAAEHRALRVRVVCPGASPAAPPLHTDLQPFLVGRFLPRPSETTKEESEDVDEEQQADEESGGRQGEEEDGEDEGDQGRPVGRALTAADYAIVRFSANAVLAPGQTVAVPRSSGGLTYGVVREAHTSFCTIDVAAPHRTAVWRVAIGPAGAFKDLPAAIIGFFPRRDQRPSPLPPVLALQNSISNPNEKKDDDTKGAPSAATRTTTTEDEEIETKQKQQKEKGEEKLAVVIDGRDVGSSFAFDRRMVSTSGIETTVKYYEARGCTVHVLVPECCLAPAATQLPDEQQQGISAAQLWVDDSSYLHCLEEQGRLTTTPAHDGAPYLEALARLCRTSRAYAVTNASCPRGSPTAWLADHTLRYTTDGFAFIPVLTALPPPLH